MITYEEAMAGGKQFIEIEPWDDLKKAYDEWLRARGWTFEMLKDECRRRLREEREAQREVTARRAADRAIEKKALEAFEEELEIERMFEEEREAQREVTARRAADRAAAKK